MENPAATIERLLSAGPLGPVRRAHREPWFVADARGPGRNDRALARAAEHRRGFRMAGVWLDEPLQPAPCRTCNTTGRIARMSWRLSAFGRIRERRVVPCPACRGTGMLAR